MTTYTISSTGSDSGPTNAGWNWVASQTITTGDTITVVANLDFETDGVTVATIDVGGGTFDGGKESGYSITVRATVAPTSSGILQVQNGTIQNVTINTANIYSPQEAILLKYDGGKTQYGTITNILIDGVASVYPTIGHSGGGITCYSFGKSDTESFISQCDVTIKDISPGSSTQTSGGICSAYNRYINVSDCIVKCNESSITSDYYGGIVASDVIVYVTITNCWTNIPLTGTIVAGILLSNSSSSSCGVSITGCISTGTMLSNGGGDAGGIVATIYIDNTISDSEYFDVTTGPYNIRNCYFTSDITDTGANYNTGGILGFVSERIATLSILKITNCYASGTDINSAGGGMIFGFASQEKLQITGCLVKSGQVYGSSSYGSDYRNGGNNSMTLDENLGTDWSPSIWTAGTGIGSSLYPTLNAFTTNPWGSYTNYNDVPELGATGGGGGDPHIVPIYGKPYELPVTEKTYLLFDNCQPENMFTVKAKCIIRNGLSFFKYIRIETITRDYIIDVDDLRFKKYTTEEDLEKGNLQIVKKEFNRNRDKRNYLWKDNKMIKTLTIDIPIPEFGAVVSIYSRKNTVNIDIPRKTPRESYRCSGP